MAEDLERAVYVQRLDSDRTEAYVRAHDDVPEAVTDAMARADVRCFELYLRDDIAVCVLEAPDVEAYFAEVEADEGVRDWERFVAQFKRAGVDVDAAEDEDVVPTMERIWAFPPG